MRTFINAPLRQLMTDRRPSEEPVMTFLSRLSHTMHVMAESTTLLNVVSASPLLPLMIWP